MVGLCNERGRAVLNLFGLIATLSLLGCSLGMAHSWSLDVCQNFSGSCIAFEMVMVLFLVREIAAPLSEEVVNFSVSCSCSMCALFAGLYACAVVGISITAQTQDWQVVGVCAPAPFVYIMFGFAIAGSLYITTVIACAVAQLDSGNQSHQDHSRRDPQAQNSQPANSDGTQLERWQHRGLSTEELAIIPRYFIPSHDQSLSPCFQHNSSGNPAHSAQVAGTELSREQIAVVIMFPNHSATGNPIIQNSQAQIPITGSGTAGSVRVRNSCAICLGDCDGWVRQLRCGHRFHVACIDQWLSKRNSCVLCRAPATLCPISQKPLNRP
jgi:Ring finger domain